MNTTKKVCLHQFLNCNCWYVVDTKTNTLIYRGVSYDEANKYRLTQDDAATLKMTPWASSREVVERLDAKDVL